MAAQYAYVMKNMTKTFPGAQKPVLSNINIQFYQGAKIGIVGPNGVGKSTLMKIMAGIDTDFTGEAWPGEYITVGALEPQFYAALLEKLQLDAAQFPQWNRQDWPESREKFAQIFAIRTRAQWCDLLEGTDVCFAPVLSPQEAAEHHHLRARNIYIERECGLEARAAPRFDGKIRDLGTIPKPGEHTEEILEAMRQGEGNVWKALARRST